MSILTVGCISFDSYIKPQLLHDLTGFVFVVYLLIPTSNHNPAAITLKLGWVVYLLIPTSNHNTQFLQIQAQRVVYLLIPTSNHNASLVVGLHPGLYIF